MTVSACLAAFLKAGAELVVELEREYPAGTRIKFQLRDGVPPSEAEVTGTDKDRPGRVQIKYDNDFESSVWCEQIVGRA